MKRNESESFKRLVFGYRSHRQHREWYSGPTIRPSGNRCTQTITIRVVLCSRLPFVRSPILLSMPNFVLKSNSILSVPAECETRIRHRYLHSTPHHHRRQQQSFHVNCFLFLGSHLFRVSIPFHAEFMCRMWWYLSSSRRLLCWFFTELSFHSSPLKQQAFVTDQFSHFLFVFMLFFLRVVRFRRATCAPTKHKMSQTTGIYIRKIADAQLSHSITGIMFAQVAWQHGNSILNCNAFSLTGVEWAHFFCRKRCSNQRVRVDE